MDDDELDHAIAICAICDTPQSVRIWPDGSIRPIGTGKGPECACGSTEFRIASDDPDVIDSQEDDASVT